MTSKAAGDNTILVGPTGCMYVANSSYLCTPYNVPWAHTQIGSAGSFTAGVAAAYEAMIRKGKWKGKFPNIICEAGDGSASDIGLASISGALYRNHDCLIICYDNEQYANTGIQASSRTPYGGMTTFSPPGPEVPEGKKLFPKDLARMMAAGHPHCYVATASVGYPIDLMNKVRKGLNHKGAAYLMVYTPCQKGFVYETPRSIDLGRLVVECGLYPMWEWNPEKRAFDYSFRPASMRPVSEYLKLQGRFGHLHAEHIATLQKFANEQWRMMGVALPEALIQAADAKNLVNMAAADRSRPWRRPYEHEDECSISPSLPSRKPSPKDRKVTSSRKARSAGPRATYGRKRRSTATTPCCACTRAMRSSPTTGTPTKCWITRATTSRDTRSRCARWRPGAR
jgi:pyruvate/2-oxoacid:ferredoxin oxidoreductase beta subunit